MSYLEDFVTKICQRNAFRAQMFTSELFPLEASDGTPDIRMETNTGPLTENLQVNFEDL